MVNNFEEFCGELIRCGFSLGGGSDKGIYAIVPFDWRSKPEDTPVEWHTGDPETDPWQWRMRVLEERNDIAYGKFFFGTSGYITREWYPYFLAARRGGEDFSEYYESGLASEMENRIYQILEDGARVPVHELKRLCGVTKEENSRFEKALTTLQGRLYITICGRAKKLDKHGLEYGWDCAVYCTSEEFWGGDITADVSPEEAAEKIRGQVLMLNPSAQERKIKKFIFG